MGVAPGPIQCEPSLVQARPLPRSLNWVSRAENELVNEWAQRQAPQRASVSGSHTRPTHTHEDGHARPSSDAPTATRGKMLGVVHVPLSCASVPFPANRSSGTVLRPAPGQSLPSHTPVGEEYYKALRSAWQRADVRPAMHIPERADSEDLEDSLILDCIDDTVGDKFDPLVPLDHMIDLLTVEWEEEGLYELERRRAEQNP